jgi:pSer/pThr/pTyr-binding forkhead associated (FHA) protein
VTQAGSIQPRHILVIDDQQGRRALGLEAATYSLGRDPTCSIVLNGPGVSRQHAILLRVPVTSGYSYRIIDGNATGKPSLNGIRVNEKRCAVADLKNKDQIWFGDEIKAQYYIIEMSMEEYTKYTSAAGFRSIKAEAVDMQQTLTSE